MSIAFNVEKIGSAIKAEMMDRMVAVAVQLQGQIQRNAPRATSSLAGSFVTTGTNVSSGVEVSVGSPKWDLYGGYVEFGTKPHWMPIEPLVTWVREKGLDKLSVDVSFRKGKAKRVGGQTTAAYRDKKIRSIARAIQFKIAKEGTAEQLYVLQSITGMGLRYKLISEGDAMYYMIDPSPLIDGAQTWSNITKRLG